MTYAELAATLNIGGDSARNLVRRRRWHRSPGNDGLARIAVPLDYLERADRSPRAPTGAPNDPTGDAAADPPTAEPANAILARHIERLEKEIEELKQERNRAAARASDRDAIAVQLRALRNALCELRDDRERWRCLAERLSALSLASRRWWWPWRRAGTSLPAVANESVSSRSAAIRAGLLPDISHRRPTDKDEDSEASLPDQAGFSLDEDAPDISTARLEQALERLAHEAEQRRNGRYEPHGPAPASADPEYDVPRKLAIIPMA
jgi:hypothetical protein